MRLFGAIWVRDPMVRRSVISDPVPQASVPHADLLRSPKAMNSGTRVSPRRLTLRSTEKDARNRTFPSRLKRRHVDVVEVAFVVAHVLNFAFQCFDNCVSEIDTFELPGTPQSAGAEYVNLH